MSAASLAQLRWDAQLVPGAGVQYLKRLAKISRHPLYDDYLHNMRMLLLPKFVNGGTDGELQVEFEYFERKYFGYYGDLIDVGLQSAVESVMPRDERFQIARAWVGFPLGDSYDENGIDLALTASQQQWLTDTAALGKLIADLVRMSQGMQVHSPHFDGKHGIMEILRQALRKYDELEYVELIPRLGMETVGVFGQCTINIIQYMDRFLLEELRALREVWQVPVFAQRNRSSTREVDKCARYTACLQRQLQHVLAVRVLFEREIRPSSDARHLQDMEGRMLQPMYALKLDCRDASFEEVRVASLTVFRDYIEYFIGSLHEWSPTALMSFAKMYVPEVSDVKDALSSECRERADHLVRISQQRLPRGFENADRHRKRPKRRK